MRPLRQSGSGKRKVRPRGITVTRILLLIATSASGTSSENVQESSPPTAAGPREPVLINFPRGSIALRPTPSLESLYLPPPPAAGVTLPEVIDNRARNSNPADPPPFVVDSVTEIDLDATPTLPKAELEAPVESGERDGRRYVYLAARSRPELLRNSARSNSGADTGSADVFVRINEMSCDDTGQELRFRASLSPSKSYDYPVLENAAGDACKVAKAKNEYTMDFEGDRFWKCGVVECSTDSGRFYCLSLRFPAISGLKLREDLKITLQCKARERIASHTKKINVKSLDTTARMAPRIAQGGRKSLFETDVGLYRKTYNSENIFDTKIQPGGSVILGEEILLRALVREGDGWKYSRISEVTVNFIEKTRRNKIVNSLSILDSSGCLNPDIREICSREQYRASPLESYVIFRAFMFENMRETDEMVLSVKVTGCLDGGDCALNCPAGHVRKARSVGNRNYTVDWRDDIAFRVILPGREGERVRDAHLLIPYVLTVFVLVAIIGSLYSVKVLRKQRVKH